MGKSDKHLQSTTWTGKVSAQDTCKIRKTDKRGHPILSIQLIPYWRSVVLLHFVFCWTASAPLGAAFPIAFPNLRQLHLLLLLWPRCCALDGASSASPSEGAWRGRGGRLSSLRQPGRWRQALRGCDGGGWLTTDLWGSIMSEDNGGCCGCWTSSDDERGERPYLLISGLGNTSYRRRKSLKKECRFAVTCPKR